MRFIIVSCILFVILAIGRCELFKDKMIYDSKELKTSATKYLINLADYMNEPVENVCLSYYKDLARVSSLFIECTVNNSRPFRVCRNCLKYYLEVQEAYELIEKDTDLYARTLYKNGLTCKNIVEATDRVQTVFNIISSVNNLWATAKCNDCFQNYTMINGSVDFNFKPEIVKFYLMQEIFEICIFKSTNKELSMDPLFQNYSSNHSLCSSCKDHYVNLTQHFAKMSQENDENNMCMDTVDLFNYTRIAWSKGYKCNYRDIDEANILIISGTVFLLTLCFYIYVRITHKEQKKNSLKCLVKEALCLAIHWQIDF